MRLKASNTFGHTIPQEKCDERNVDPGDGVVKSCGPCFVYRQAKDNTIVYKEGFPSTSNVCMPNIVQMPRKSQDRVWRYAHVLSCVTGGIVNGWYCRENNVDAYVLYPRPVWQPVTCGASTIFCPNNDHYIGSQASGRDERLRKVPRCHSPTILRVTPSHSQA